MQSLILESWSNKDKAQVSIILFSYNFAESRFKDFHSLFGKKTKLFHKVAYINSEHENY